MEIDKYVFTDIFDIEEIQKLQDLFSDANEVASIITFPNGKPITKPSNFCRLCSDFIRKSEVGISNCFKSDAEIGRYNSSGPTVKKCLSGGLWDAGVSITVGEEHIANWLIGQVKNDNIEENEIIKYADEIGVDRDEFLEAFKEVPVMSAKKFSKISEMLFVFANEISQKAYNNLLLKREIEQKETAIQQKREKESELNFQRKQYEYFSNNLPNIIWKAEYISGEDLSNTYISENVDSILELPVGTIRNSFEKYFSFVVPEYIPVIMEAINNGLKELNKVYSCIYPVIKGNGKTAWFASHGRGYMFNGKINIVGTTIDVTEQKITEDKLAESEERYRSLLENLPVGIFRSNLKGEVLSANHAMAEIYGYDSVEELLKIPAAKYYSDSNPREKMLEKLKNDGHLLDYQTQEYKKDGSLIWVSANYRLINIEGKHKSFIDGVIIDITERKNAENKVREKDVQFRKLSANVPDLIFQFTRRPDGTYCVPVASKGIKNIFGCSPEDVVEDFSPIANVLHPEDAERVVNDIEYSAKHLTYFTCEFRVLIPGREVQWIYSRSTPEKLEDGSITWYGFNMNITERKKIESKLIDAKIKSEESKERFELAMHVTLDGPYDWNLVTNEIYFSDRWKEIVGYKPNELPNDFSVWEKLTKPEDVKKSWEMLNKHIAGELSKFEMEFKMLHKNGHWVDILSRAKAQFNEDGKAIRVVGTHIDISESKRSKKLLKENEDRFRKLIEHLPSGIAIYQPVNEGNDFQFIDINKSAELITSASREKLIGHTLLEEFPGMAFSPLYEAFKKVNSTGEDEFIPSFYYKDKVREGWRENYIYKLQTGEIVAIFRDTTEIKNAENELILAKEKAEESDRLKTAFLANMSHEIRTPMNGILGFTDLLNEPGLSGEQQQSYIEIIQKSGDRMLNTVNDIIEISKIETGQVSVMLRDVNICDLLNNLIEFFKPEAEKKGIQLSQINELAEDKALIKTDELKLNSILTNLIKNAIKYSNKGSITVSCKKNKNLLEIAVKDTGIGIPVNRQKAIFERFVQADIEDTRVHEGSGLGLAITKSYVEMLGGEIGVNSAEGEGSEFYFTIENNPVKSIEVKLNQDILESEIKNLKEILILVAEDDDVSFMLLESILLKENCRLIQARNGIEAIEILKRTPEIDIILMDIKMPKMDGIVATRKIREFNKTIPIIAQTAYALGGDKEKALKAGCSQYISKPIKKEDLWRKIKRFV